MLGKSFYRLLAELDTGYCYARIDHAESDAEALAWALHQWGVRLLCVFVTVVSQKTRFRHIIYGRFPEGWSDASTW